MAWETPKGSAPEETYIHHSSTSRMQRGLQPRILSNPQALAPIPQTRRGAQLRFTTMVSCMRHMRCVCRTGLKITICGCSFLGTELRVDCLHPLCPFTSGTWQVHGHSEIPLSAFLFHLKHSPQRWTSKVCLTHSSVTLPAVLVLAPEPFTLGASHTIRPMLCRC